MSKVEWKFSDKISGDVPDNLIYVCKNPIKIQRQWDDLMCLSEDSDKQEVVPTFVVNAANPKTLETAINWAKGYSYYGGDKTEEPVQVLCPNDPIKNVQVVSLEVRSEGGRAYKVILDGKYYVDLREDILLDVLLEAGVGVGGVLNGEYIWGRIGSQLKLVRVDSVLYHVLLEAKEKGKMKNISAKDLEVGGVYTSKTGALSVYLGKYDAEDIDYTVEKVDGRYYRQDNYTYISKPIRGQQLWIDTGHSENDSYTQKIVEEALGGKWGYYFAYVKSKTVIEKVDQLDVPSIQELIEIHKKGSAESMLEEKASFHYRAVPPKLLTSRPVGESSTLINELVADANARELERRRTR